MNKNARSIKAAIERRVIIAGLIHDGEVELEEIASKLDADDMGVMRMTRHWRGVLEARKGVLEDAQAELPAESDDLQSYVDKLLDPKAAWPDEDKQTRRFLCAEQRENIESYLDPEKRKNRV